MLDKFTDTSFVLTENIHENELTLLDGEVHHLTRVRRKQIGDMFLASNGEGMTYQCEILAVAKNSITAKIHRRFAGRGEPGLHLTLALGLLKKDRLEWAIEKGTELGVNRFVPVRTERTIVPENSIRQDRYRRIAISAMKQCCRSHIPAITKVQSFAEMLKTVQNCQVRLIAHQGLGREFTMRTLLPAIGSKESVVICIGPEGGFTTAEVDCAIEHGFKPVSLGARRLRSETAAVVAAGVILALSGEI